MADSNLDLVDNFKSFYRRFHQSNLSELQTLYAADVVFKDPVHEIRGLVAVEDYMAELMRELSACRFEYLDVNMVRRMNNRQK